MFSEMSVRDRTVRKVFVGEVESLLVVLMFTCSTVFMERWSLVVAKGDVGTGDSFWDQGVAQLSGLSLPVISLGHLCRVGTV